MGKDKLRKFAENLTFDNLVQPEFDDIFRRGEVAGNDDLEISHGSTLLDHPLKGRWAADFFGNSRPIVLELGCGKGEYTVGLGAADPDRNFIGIDIKGARMWRGAKTATEMGLPNVGFLRTRIEFINSFFAPGEVSEIWVTFPDPQLKKGREKKRLTSPVFLEYYARMLAPDGAINLKTDSRELHDYTRRVIEANELPCEAACADIYGGVADGGCTSEISGPFADTRPTLSIKTAYERMFLAEGKPITYLRFGLGGRKEFEMVFDE